MTQVTNPTGEVEVLTAALLKAQQALANYADPSGYTDNLGESYAATDEAHPGKLAEHTLAEIDAMLSATPPVPDVAAIPVGMKPWAEGVGACVLMFADGALTLNRDGSGELSFDEDELEWVPADDSTKDYRVCKLPTSEVEAIRDHLNKHFPPPVAPVATGSGDALREALNDYDEPMSLLTSAERGERLADRVRAALSATHPTTAADTGSTEGEAATARVLEALAKVMPARVHNGPDYAEVYFADGASHSTQAMTMHPADWQELSDAFAAMQETSRGD